MKFHALDYALPQVVAGCISGTPIATHGKLQDISEHQNILLATSSDR